MKTNDSTQIIAEAGKQELFIIREFDIKRERLFEAFSTPEILEKFYAPFGNKMVFNAHDYRTGGSYSWCNIDQQGRILCTFNGVIHEIHAPERIIHTSEFMELPERGHVVLEVMAFEELPYNRTRLRIHDVCLSVEDRDAMLQSGMESGLVEIFRQLDNLLTSDL
ncbi:MAG TPA: SRPBCC domain-containing protein [Cyclobacteriaceae bacterium]|nr:SRPBCC domain-containing protein [Cyclobacteriaceae bacterium]